MGKKPKIAIIGIGRWGKVLLKEFTKQADIFCCDLKESDDAKIFLKENYPNLPITTDYHKILSDESIEAVVIATPTKTHFEIANQALENKKHVFLEKPGGTNSQDLEKLNKKARLMA